MYENLDDSPGARQTLRQIWIAFGIAAGIGLPIAWLAPNDVLTRMPLLREFTNAVTWVVPSIAKKEMYSDFPQVMRLYLGFMWSWIPLYLYLLLRFFAYPVPKQNLALHFQRRTLRNVLVYGVASPVLVVSGLLIGDGVGKFSLNMDHSRLGLSVIGILVPFVLAALSALSVVWVQFMFRKYLSRKR